MARAVTIFLEVVADPRWNHWQAYCDALALVRRSRLSGRPILALVDPTRGIDVCTVPHKGYDYRCARGECEHEEPLGQVRRYSGLWIVLEGGDLTAEEHCRYRISAWADLIVCGFERPEPQTCEREKVKL